MSGVLTRGFPGAERILFWTFAVAAFAAAAAGLGARAVDRLAVGYETQRDQYAIVQVLAPDGPVGISAAVTALAHAPHVASAAPITERRAAALLEQWTGEQVNGEEMPPLRLIEVELTDTPAHGDVAGDIEASLAQGGVTAQVISAPDTGAGGGAAPRARNVALWAAGLFAGVMALIISLAARGLAARRQDLVAVMTDLGATAGQAAGRVGDEAAVLGFKAGLVGALAAAAAGIALTLAFLPSATPEALPQLLTMMDAAPLAIAPFLTAIAAGMGARAGAESVHAQAARLA